MKKITVGDRSFVVSPFTKTEMTRCSEIAKAIRAGRPHTEFASDVMGLVTASFHRADASVDRATVEQLELETIFRIATEICLVSAELPEQWTKRKGD
jgi:hypothetical protein